MSFSYKAALVCLRDARSKRGRNIVTKKFIDTLKVINRELPMFDVNTPVIDNYSQITDDYSTQLLQQGLVAGVAKQVSADGNCLFNAVSVALISKNKIIIPDLMLEIY